MKIAMIGSRGIPVTYSGIETHLEELCPRLVRMGHQVTVYCKSASEYREPVYKGVRLSRLPAVNSKHFETLSRSFLAVFSELFSSNDIVHFHALGPSILAFLPKIFRKKTAVTVHGLDWQRAKWGKVATACLKGGEWSSSHFCDATICVSKVLQEYYQKKYHKHAFYVPNGVNIPVPVPAGQIHDLGLEKKKYILFLSRLVPEKGCHYLIEAFKRLKTDMKLVIAGGGGHTDDHVRYLKDLAASDERILFTGFVSGNLLRELFSNAYLFVLPSEMEGLPIALLEAMSNRLCVLTSNIPENLEVSEGYGFSFQNRDSLSLSEKLEFLLKHPELVEEKGRAGLEMVRKEYNWDFVTRKTLEVYQEIV